MNYIIPPGFEGNLNSKKFAIDLVADSLNAEERWEIDEISDKIFKRFLGRKSTRPINAKTEKYLFLRYHQGDLEARNLLVFANLRLVNSIARQFRPHKLTCNDIISEGLVGLLKAIDGYDINSDYRFLTYAYKTIYYHIRNFINTNSYSTSFPSSIYSLKSRYINFYNKYFQTYFCSPSNEDVAEVLNISLHYAKGLKESFFKPISIELLCDSLGHDFVMEDLLDDITMAEHHSFDSSLTYLSLKSDINTALKKIGEREAIIIRLNFGIGCPVLTLEEIGMKFDLTRERIRQLRDRAIRQLRGKNGRDLKQYLAIDIL